MYLRVIIIMFVFEVYNFVIRYTHLLIYTKNNQYVAKIFLLMNFRSLSNRLFYQKFPTFLKIVGALKLIFSSILIFMFKKISLIKMHFRLHYYLKNIYCYVYIVNFSNLMYG